MSGPWDPRRPPEDQEGSWSSSESGPESRREPRDTSWDDWSWAGTPETPEPALPGWDEWSSSPVGPGREPEPPTSDPWAESWDVAPAWTDAPAASPPETPAPSEAPPPAPAAPETSAPWEASTPPSELAAPERPAPDWPAPELPVGDERDLTDEEFLEAHAARRDPREALEPFAMPEIDDRNEPDEPAFLRAAGGGIAPSEPPAPLPTPSSPYAPWRAEPDDLPVAWEPERDLEPTVPERLPSWWLPAPPDADAPPEAPPQAEPDATAVPVEPAAPPDAEFEPEPEPEPQAAPPVEGMPAELEQPRARIAYEPDVEPAELPLEEDLAAQVAAPPPAEDAWPQPEQERWSVTEAEAEAEAEPAEAEPRLSEVETAAPEAAIAPELQAEDGWADRRWTDEPDEPFETSATAEPAVGATIEAEPEPTATEAEAEPTASEELEPAPTAEARSAEEAEVETPEPEVAEPPVSAEAATGAEAEAVDEAEAEAEHADWWDWEFEAVPAPEPFDKPAVPAATPAPAAMEEAPVTLEIEETEAEPQPAAAAIDSDRRAATLEDTAVLPVSARPQPIGDDHGLQPTAGRVETTATEPWADADVLPEATTAEQAVPWLIGVILLLAGMVVILMALIFAGEESLGAIDGDPSPGAGLGLPAAGAASPSTVASATPVPSASGEVVAAASPSAAPPAPPAAQFGALEMVYLGRSAALAPIYLLRHDFTTEEEPVVLAQDPNLDVRDFTWAPDGSHGAALLVDVLVSIEPNVEKRQLADSISTITFADGATPVYAARVSQSGTNETASVLAIDYVSGEATEIASVTYPQPDVAADSSLREAQFLDEGGAVRLYWTGEGLLHLWVLGGGSWQINPADGVATKLEGDPVPTLRSPDGRDTVLITESGTTSTLSHQRASGAELASTTVEGLVSHLRWSPDGGQVVFTLGRANPNGGVVQDLYLWDLNDQPPVPITNTGAAFGADWMGVEPNWQP